MREEMLVDLKTEQNLKTDQRVYLSNFVSNVGFTKHTKITHVAGPLQSQLISTVLCTNSLLHS